MTISLEKIFFKYILENKKYFHIVDPSYFKNREIEFVYKVIQKYMKSNNEVETPSPKQILEMVKIDDHNDMITKDILKAMLTVNTSEYNEDNFIVPKLNAWILSNKVRSGTVDIIDETRELDNISEFDDVMNRIYKIKEIVDDMSNTNFISDDEDLGSDFDDVESHYQDSAMDKVSSGFETIDHILGGGWDTGSLNLFMGETSNGKCFCKNTTIRIRKNVGNCEISTMEIEKIFTIISKGSTNI